jgi:hypothetical protein
MTLSRNLIEKACDIYSTNIVCDTNHVWPVHGLLQIRPTSSLLGPQNVASVLGLWIVNVLFVLINLSYMHIQPDYVKWPAK